ncbi:hypothetical protein [Providencia sp. PROV130]|uniref:hypothetical protein n=1 Tax=Providencia sp. PROV130 TaxID=2949840 RepID=UPI002349A01B|nr:hypothetical protein [Providencia sp. PROV130]
MDISGLGCYNPLNIKPLPLSSSAIEQTNLPFKGEVTLNHTLDLHERAFDAFQQMGYRIPEVNIQPPPVNDSLENIQLKAKMLAYKHQHANDSYEEARGLSARKQVADGRPHIAGISRVIENIYTDYQQKYGELVKASTQYMQDMNTMASKLSRYMKAGEEGKINIKLEATLNDMDEIVAKYSGTSMEKEVKAVASGSVKNKDAIENLQNKIKNKQKEYKKLMAWNILNINQDKMNQLSYDMDEYEKEIEQLEKDVVIKEGVSIGEYYGKWKPDFDNAKPLMEIKGSAQEIAFWEKKLSGQGFICEKSNGTLSIFPDLKPVKEIFYALNYSSLKWGDEGSDISSQEFQSLQTAIDGQKNTINSSVSRLLETFRQDNSHFETLTQLLIQLYKDLQQYNNGYVNM